MSSESGGILNPPSEEDMLLIERLIDGDVSHMYIAAHFGISAKTFTNRQKQFPLLQNRITRAHNERMMHVMSKFNKFIDNEKHPKHYEAVSKWIDRNLQTLNSNPLKSSMEQNDKPTKVSAVVSLPPAKLA